MNLETESKGMSGRNLVRFKRKAGQASCKFLVLTGKANTVEEERKP